MHPTHSRSADSEFHRTSHVPIWATLLFIVTMMVVYFLGRAVIVYYELGTPVL